MAIFTTCGCGVFEIPRCLIYHAIFQNQLTFPSIYFEFLYSSNHAWDTYSAWAHMHMMGWRKYEKRETQQNPTKEIRKKNRGAKGNHWPPTYFVLPKIVIKFCQQKFAFFLFASNSFFPWLLVCNVILHTFIQLTSPPRW